MSRITLVLGLALLTVEAALAAWIVAASDQTGTDSFALAIPAGVVFVVSGLIALMRRPENRTGVYLAAVGYLWLLSALGDANDSLIFTIGLLLSGLVWVPFGALVLSYPSGKLETRLERGLPIVAGVLLTSTSLVEALFDETPAPNRCEACPESALFVSAQPSLVAAARGLAALGSIALITIVVALLVRRWRAATPALRRLLTPVLATASITLTTAGLFVIADQVLERAAGDLLLLFYAAFATVPLAFLYGILRTRLARSSVAEVVMALEHGVPLRTALADALGDPSVEIAFRRDVEHAAPSARWMDSDGRSVPEPAPAPGRAVTFIDQDGERVAALTCDASLMHEPELVEAVTAAAGLAISNERLQAELRAEISLAEALTSTVPALLSNVDLEGRLLSLNPAALAASGHDHLGDVLGRSFWDVFIAPEEREEVMARFARAAPDYPRAEYENAFTNARGEQLVIYWRSAPVHDETGAVVNVVAGGLDITERRRRELELERERDVQSTVFESMPSIMVVLAPDGTIRDRSADDPSVGANRAFREAVRWPDAELVGRSLLDLVVEDDDGRAARAIAAAARGEASEPVESELRSADGTARAFAWSAIPVADVTGRLERLVLVSGTDITERNRLEQEKERERAFLNAIANTAPSILCIVDDRGVIQERATNMAFEHALEHDADDVGGHAFWDLVAAPVDAEAVRAVIESVVAGEELDEQDHRWVTSSGRTLVVAWTCTPLPRVDERRLFLISGVDVTERRERELEVGRQRDLLRAITDAAPSYLVTVDLNGVVVEHNNNRAFLNAFGWTEDEVAGQSFLGLIGREDDFIARIAIANAANGVPQPERETIWRSRDGEERVVAWTARQVVDPGGRRLVLVSGTDITTRRRQEEELRASRARLVQAEDQARRKLERNLHDGAQQRLVALSISLRLAESKLATDPAAAVSILAGAREELGHALEELRELARGIHPAVLTDRGLEPALEAVAGRSPVPVTLDVQVEGLPRDVEAAAYYVVAESLANVAKYAGATSVSVSVSRGSGSVTVTVADNGAGGADPGKGTGLRGLADRVAVLDGTLAVSSEPGAGTRVEAVIPLAGHEHAVPAPLEAGRS